jgi:hypothetical protein
MNIDEIYGYQKPLLESLFSDMYNKFVRDIDKDPNFELADDEMTELFNELVFKYLAETMTDYELMRCYNNTKL